MWNVSLFCCFYLCNAIFITKKFLYSYISIASHVKISSKLVTKKNHVRSVKFTGYFTSKCFWYKFNLVPILLLIFQFLQHRHEFYLDQHLFNLIIYVKKWSIFTPVSPINSKFLGAYLVQPVPIPFHKTLPISFSYRSFSIFFSKTTMLTFEWIQLHLIFYVLNQVIDKLKCVVNSNWTVTLWHFNY